MASAIDDTKPSAGTATTASVRAQFTTAKAEITALQATTGTHTSQLGGLTVRVTALEARGSAVLTETLDASVAAGDTVTVTHPSVPWPGDGGHPGAIQFSVQAEAVAPDEPDEVPAAFTFQDLNEAGAAWVQDAANTGHFTAKPHPTMNLRWAKIGATELIVYGADPTVAGSCETGALLAAGVHAIEGLKNLGPGQVKVYDALDSGGAGTWAVSEELIDAATAPSVGRLKIYGFGDNTTGITDPRGAISVDGGITWLQWEPDMFEEWQPVTLAQLCAGSGMQIPVAASTQEWTDYDGAMLPDEAWTALAGIIASAPAASVKLAVAFRTTGAGDELLDGLKLVWAEPTVMEPCTCGRTGSAVDFEVRRTSRTTVEFTRPAATPTLTGVRCQVWTFDF